MHGLQSGRIIQTFGKIEHLWYVESLHVALTVKPLSVKDNSVGSRTPAFFITETGFRNLAIRPE